MQVRVVTASGDTGFNALVYQQPNSGIIEYLQNSIGNAATKLGSAGSAFVNMANQRFEKFNSDSVITAAKAIASRLDGHLNPNVITAYSDDNIFNATPIMRRYIMVQPNMWELNSNQACSAFDGMYQDIDPEVTSVEDHTLYKRVVNDMLEFDEDGNGQFVSYTDCNEEEDLHFMDQLSIKDTWDTVSNLIAEGIDPSSQDGDEL